MTSGDVSADDSSIALGGDNSGIVLNAPNSTIVFNSPIAIERTLSTHLGTVISVIAEQQLSEYGSGIKREITSEVKDKLEFNYIDLDDQLFRKYTTYYHLLDKAYKGVEQSNADVRFLVLLSAGSIYSRVLTESCTLNNIAPQNRIQHSRDHAHQLIEAVKAQLIQDVHRSQASDIDPAIVDLAVSLLVADAVAECEVLEKARDVTSA